VNVDLLAGIQLALTPDMNLTILNFPTLGFLAMLVTLAPGCGLLRDDAEAPATDRPETKRWTCPERAAGEFRAVSADAVRTWVGPCGDLAILKSSGEVVIVPPDTLQAIPFTTLKSASPNDDGLVQFSGNGRFVFVRGDAADTTWLTRDLARSESFAVPKSAFELGADPGARAVVCNSLGDSPGATLVDFDVRARIQVGSGACLAHATFPGGAAFVVGEDKSEKMYVASTRISEVPLIAAKPLARPYANDEPSYSWFLRGFGNGFFAQQLASVRTGGDSSSSQSVRFSLHDVSGKVLANPESSNKIFATTSALAIVAVVSQVIRLEADKLTQIDVQGEPNYIARDGQIVARDGWAVRLYDHRGTVLWQKENHRDVNVAEAANGMLHVALLTGTSDAHVLLRWDADTQRELAPINLGKDSLRQTTSLGDVITASDKGDSLVRKDGTRVSLNGKLRVAAVSTSATFLAIEGTDGLGYLATLSASNAGPQLLVQGSFGLTNQGNFIVARELPGGRVLAGRR
jgi:hypothetical protein